LCQNHYKDDRYILVGLFVASRISLRIGSSLSANVFKRGAMKFLLALLASTASS